MLTAILLISSSVMTVLSPSLTPLSPMVLEVEFASASSSSENGGDEEPNTDATTTDDEEDGDVQEDDTEGQQPQPQQHQQVPGTTTSPHSGGGTTTTPLIPDDDSTETPPTDTTTTTVEIPAGSEDTPSDTTSPQSPTDTSSQQGGQSSSGLPSPYNVAPPQSPTDTPSQGGQQGQGQQPQPQQVPGTTSPDSSSASGTTTFPGGISITKGPDSGVSAIIPDGGVRIYSGPNGVSTIVHPTGQLYRGSDGSVNLKLPNAEHISLSPDGTGEISLEDGDTTITGNRDGTLTIEKPYVDPNTNALTDARIRSTYSLDGNVATENPDGTPTSTKIGSVNGGVTTFPDSGISIYKDPSGRVHVTIPDKDSKEVTISSGPNGGVDSIAHSDDRLDRQDNLRRGSDGSVNVLLFNDDGLSLSPDGTGEISLEDGDTTITGNRDGTLTISKPHIDPNTGARGASITTTYKAPP